MGVGWGFWVSRCLFKTSDWMPKLFWQQLLTGGRALSTAEQQLVGQCTPPRWEEWAGWDDGCKEKMRATQLLLGNVWGSLSVQAHLWLPAADTTQSVPHTRGQLTSAVKILITCDRKQSGKLSHVLSGLKTSPFSKVSPEFSAALLCPVSYENIHASSERALTILWFCKMGNIDIVTI